MTRTPTQPTIGRRVADRFRTLTGFDLVVALACPAVLLVAGGPLVGSVGLFGVGIWLVAPVYGFALGQLGLLLVVSSWPGLQQVLLFQGALAALLLAELVHERAQPLVFGGFLVGLAGLGGAVGLALDVGTDPWTVTLAFGVVTGLAGYGIHRLELVRLGLVEAVS